jgi:hypothetical protein
MPGVVRRLRAQRQLEDSEDEDEDYEEEPTLLVSRTELVESSYSELLPLPARDLNRQGLVGFGGAGKVPAGSRAAYLMEWSRSIWACPRRERRFDFKAASGIL